jgi:hypothetical protein
MTKIRHAPKGSFDLPPINPVVVRFLTVIFRPAFGEWSPGISTLLFPGGRRPLSSILRESPLRPFERMVDINTAVAVVVLGHEDEDFHDILLARFGIPRGVPMP